MDGGTANLLVGGTTALGAVGAMAYLLWSDRRSQITIAPRRSFLMWRFWFREACAYCLALGSAGFLFWAAVRTYGDSRDVMPAVMLVGAGVILWNLVNFFGRTGSRKVQWVQRKIASIPNPPDPMEAMREQVCRELVIPAHLLNVPGNPRTMPETAAAIRAMGAPGVPVVTAGQRASGTPMRDLLVRQASGGPYDPSFIVEDYAPRQTVDRLRLWQTRPVPGAPEGPNMGGDRFPNMNGDVFGSSPMTRPNVFRSLWEAMTLWGRMMWWRPRRPGTSSPCASDGSPGGPTIALDPNRYSAEELSFLAGLTQLGQGIFGEAERFALIVKGRCVWPLAWGEAPAGDVLRRCENILAGVLLSVMDRVEPPAFETPFSEPTRLEFMDAFQRAMRGFRALGEHGDWSPVWGQCPSLDVRLPQARRMAFRIWPSGVPGVPAPGAVGPSAARPGSGAVVPPVPDDREEMTRVFRARLSPQGAGILDDTVLFAGAMGMRTQWPRAEWGPPIPFELMRGYQEYMSAVLGRMPANPPELWSCQPTRPAAQYEALRMAKERALVFISALVGGPWVSEWGREPGLHSKRWCILRLLSLLRTAAGAEPAGAVDPAGTAGQASPYGSPPHLGLSRGPSTAAVDFIRLVTGHTSQEPRLAWPVVNWGHPPNANGLASVAARLWDALGNGHPPDTFSVATDASHDRRNAEQRRVVEDVFRNAVSYCIWIHDFMNHGRWPADWGPAPEQEHVRRHARALEQMLRGGGSGSGDQQADARETSQRWLDEGDQRIFDAINAAMPAASRPDPARTFGGLSQMAFRDPGAASTGGRLTREALDQAVRDIGGPPALAASRTPASAAAAARVVEEARRLVAAVRGSGLQAPVDALEAAVRVLDGASPRPRTECAPPPAGGRVMRADLVAGEQYVLVSRSSDGQQEVRQEVTYEGPCTDDPTAFLAVHGQERKRSYYADYGLEPYGGGKWNETNHTLRAEFGREDARRLLRELGEGVDLEREFPPQPMG